jgi:hypothetical protein
MIMDKQDIFNSLIAKERDLKHIAKLATNSPEIINYLITGISESNTRIKYGCINTLVIISEKNPELLYSQFDIFKEYLISKNKFIKWASILIIANMSKLDNENKFDAIFDSYFSEITGPVMITAANITKGAAIIAKAKPYLTERIKNELLKIKSAKYQTDECLNIAFGHMISSFDRFFKQVKNKTEVMDLVKQQINNPRKPTKNKAEKFIKKWGKQFEKN